ncbi:MAG: hypothetical protein ACODAE_05225 [Gemmatimonadota bacterium]
MSLDPQLLDLAPHSVTVNAFSTRDADGAATYSTAGSTYSALVDETPRRIRTAAGEEVVSAATVYLLSTSADIGVQDKLTLPDGSTPKILRTAEHADEDGTHHTVVHLG